MNDSGFQSLVDIIHEAILMKIDLLNSLIIKVKLSNSTK